MQKKIYVAGLIDEQGEQSVNQAVAAISGVTSCTASAMKAQVLVDYDEAVAGIEDSINQAIKGVGLEVLA
ncbi:MAG: heavy metal transporter [Treponema sp.]|nr:heavy metal transporter [Spirochaetia bacterium]MDD7275848.1 heavy metal transporter [Treponema sp.]MDY3755145.1 heavy metal transporter [Treponema sp.]